MTRDRKLDSPMMEQVAADRVFIYLEWLAIQRHLPLQRSWTSCARTSFCRPCGNQVRPHRSQGRGCGGGGGVCVWGGGVTAMVAMVAMVAIVKGV